MSASRNVSVDLLLHTSVIEIQFREALISDGKHEWLAVFFGVAMVSPSISHPLYS